MTIADSTTNTAELTIEDPYPQFRRVPVGLRERNALALWTLAVDFGGEVAGPEITSAWRKQVESYGVTFAPGAMTSMIRTFERQGLIGTGGGGVRGRRMTRAVLTAATLPPMPESFGVGRDARFIDNSNPPPPLVEDPIEQLRSFAKTVKIDEPEVEPEPVVVEPAIEPAIELDVELDTSPLTNVGARLSAAASLIYESLFELAELRPMEAVDDAVAERLAMTLDENQRLRMKLRDASETAAAHKAALDAAQKMNHQLQANLNRALGKPLDDKAWRELERMVQAKPTRR